MATNLACNGCEDTHTHTHTHTHTSAHIHTHVGKYPNAHTCSVVSGKWAMKQGLGPNPISAATHINIHDAEKHA